MDRQALCEDVVDLYAHIGLAYVKKYDKDPPQAVHISLFERAHSFIIHSRIQKERKDERVDKEKDKSKPDHCSKCGRKLTPGELKYMKDTEGDRLCYHCGKE